MHHNGLSKIVPVIWVLGPQEVMDPLGEEALKEKVCQQCQEEALKVCRLSLSPGQPALCPTILAIMDANSLET